MGATKKRKKNTGGPDIEKHGQLSDSSEPLSFRGGIKKGCGSKIAKKTRTKQPREKRRRTEKLVVGKRTADKTGGTKKEKCVAKKPEI